MRAPVGEPAAEPVADRERHQHDGDRVRPDDRGGAEVRRHEPRGGDLGTERGHADREDEHAQQPVVRGACGDPWGWRGAGARSSIIVEAWAACRRGIQVRVPCVRLLGARSDLERAHLDRAQRRLGSLALYPRPLDMRHVRILHVPWLFRLPWFRRFHGYEWGR